MLVTPEPILPHDRNSAFTPASSAQSFTLTLATGSLVDQFAIIIKLFW